MNTLRLIVTGGAAVAVIVAVLRFTGSDVPTPPPTPEVATGAAAQRADFGTLLLALQAVIAETDTPEAVEMLATETLRARFELCVALASQETGLPLL